MEKTKKNEPEIFLSLRHLEKVYPNGEKAVVDFNLDVRKKEFIVIVGPSGCGKSTTLRMIAGLEDITSGDIFLEDELLNYRPSKDRKMAIVFQSYALYPQMNVFDNIAFPLTINTYPAPVVDRELYPLGESERLLAQVEGAKLMDTVEMAFKTKGKTARTEKLAVMCRISPAAAEIIAELYNEKAASCTPDTCMDKWKRQIEERIEKGKARLAAQGVCVNERFEILDENGQVKTEQRKLTPFEIRAKVYDTAEILDLKAYLDKLPKELSGGQMQRVALGRAIIKNVPIFMMDEPLSNLDAKLRLTMRSEIVKLHNRIQATTIYVTHDQTEAMTMATRIVVMSRGFIQQIGTPEEIYNTPANIFVARFIGSPTMNLFDGQFDPVKRTVTFGGVKIELDAEFTARHDAFYRRKAEELKQWLETFDERARENVLKLLSATGENFDGASGGGGRQTLWAKLKDRFGKKAPEKAYPQERAVCAEKIKRLVACLSAGHTLTVGIRPERVRIEKKGTDKGENDAFIVKPTVCELLGGEYNVHFDFCGKNMVGKVDACRKISVDDEIVVGFAAKDLYFFDPITGDIIR